MKHKHKSKGNIKKNNKQIGAIAFVIVTIVTIAIALVLSKHLFYSINTAFEDGNMHTAESAKVFQDMSIAYPMFDYSMIFVIIGLTIGLIITSFMIPSHPIFMVINIVGLVFLVFLGAVMSNFYGDFINSGEFNSTIDIGGGLDKTGYIMDKLPFICAFIVLISTIVMYAKGRGEAEG